MIIPLALYPCPRFVVASLQTPLKVERYRPRIWLLSHAISEVKSEDIQFTNLQEVSLIKFATGLIPRREMCSADCLLHQKNACTVSDINTLQIRNKSVIQIFFPFLPDCWANDAFRVSRNMIINYTLGVLKSSLHFVVAYLQTLLKAGRCRPQIWLLSPVCSEIIILYNSYIIIISITLII